METCAVRSFSSVPEVTSDSDDEDKLHIVEEDSIPDDLDPKSSVFPLKATQQLSSTCTQDEECITDEEDEEVAGQEKQVETSSIYSDAPEEHQSTPERGVHDENGTPDAFSYLHTCPHCSRGYKRHTSLKEHIKLRHEKSDDNYCCSFCSYTFTYRTQLVRHMTSHRNVREQLTISQSSGNRKFKCTECSKAFKYKHHLKEHLRIHSGEKPYECSNCQKRFSHSGSYSSHISSKKCAGGTPAVNSVTCTPGVKAAMTISLPTRILLREKVDINNKPLQEQLPLKQIKQEPVEHQPKAVSATPPINTTTNGVAATNVQGVVQTLVVPTVGLVQPISINLSDLQNVLNAAMDGNVLRQVLASASVNGTNTKILGQVQTQTQAQAIVLQQQQTQQQPVISAISLPFVGQEGNGKIIINYNPQLDSQLNAFKVNATQPVVTQPIAAQAGTPQEQSMVSDVTQPKVVQIQSAQSNLTKTQTSSTLNAKPTQVNIIKPVQAGNPTKPASIIRLTSAQAARLVQARASQPKLTQQSLLLVRRADGTQSLVVRQVAIANPNTQSNPTVETKPTEIKSSPEKTTNTALEPQDDRRETTENTNSMKSDDCKQKLTANVSLGIKIKTEPDSPSKIETEMEEEGEKDMETDKDKEEGKQAANNAVSHSGTVHNRVVCGDNFHNYASCLLCESGPSKLKLFDSLNGDTKGSPKTISLSSLLDKDKSGAAERLLPLLKAYSQDPNPTEEQLSQVAKSVKLPLEAVCKWYQKMRSKKILLKAASNLKNSQHTKDNTLCEITPCENTPCENSPCENSPCENTSCENTPCENTPCENTPCENTPCENTPCDPSDASQEKNTTQDTCTPTQPLDDTLTDTQNATLSAASPDSATDVSTDDLVIVKTEDIEEELQCEPLDLSIPKSISTHAITATKQPISNQNEPLNLTALKKQSLPSNTIYVTQTGTGPLNIMTAPLQTLVAIADPNGVPCIGTTLSTNKQTILIPQLTYTYSNNSNVKTTDYASADTNGMVILNNCKVADTASDCVSGVDDQTDEDAPLAKKRKTGLYACDLCDKIFQKSSSLLRHKYEHTGKRPHACFICKKAFKHKHHLIEHTRLHSGEKPYQCDKCGKRFSHSGSYSQHMNHRYSYCKRDTYEPPGQNSTSTPTSQLDSDERASDGEEEEEEVDYSGLDMSDIRVVRVGEEYEEDQDGRHEEHETDKGEMEVEPGDFDTLLEEVWETVETEDAMETEESKEVSGNAEEDRNLTYYEENSEMTTEQQQND